MTLTSSAKPFLLWLLILLGLFTAACDKQPTIRPLQHDTVILAFGDSLTYGTGAATGESYPEVLAKLLDTTVINAGIPGEISLSGRNRLPALLEEHQPDLVILCHGGNDFLRRSDSAIVVENLHAMIRMSRDAGANVLLVGVPDFSLTLSTHPLYKQLAGELSVPYEGEVVEQLLTDRTLKSDRIHPNAQGYRLMAEALAKLIQESQEGY